MKAAWILPFLCPGFFCWPFCSCSFLTPRELQWVIVLGHSDLLRAQWLARGHFNMKHSCCSKGQSWDGSAPAWSLQTPGHAASISFFFSVFFFFYIFFFFSGTDCHRGFIVPQNKRIILDNSHNPNQKKVSRVWSFLFYVIYDVSLLTLSFCQNTPLHCPDHHKTSNMFIFPAKPDSWTNNYTLSLK